MSRETAKDAGWAYLNLAVLWTFAVAQPLFDLLKDNPEFFAARGSTGFDIISFSVLLVVLPPAVLLGIELLLGLIRPEVRRGAHIVFLGALVALIAAQALKKSIDASDTVLIALSVLVGVALAALWARAEPVRSFLNILSPVPLVFLLLFLLSGQISELAFPDEAKARSIGGVSRAPIVVVLLDELPSNTLVDANDELDTERYPGFAELAKNATWFKNAYTVYDSTERAQPAIMDGNLPEKDQPADPLGPPEQHLHAVRQEPPDERERGGHLGLLARPLRGHAPRGVVRQPDLLDVRGPRARLAARGLAAGHRERPGQRVRELGELRRQRRRGGGRARPPRSVNTRSNLNGGRAVRFQEWIDNIVPGRRPALNFKHTLMPHVPWQYLPSGKRYRKAPNDVIPGLSNQSFEDTGQLNVLLQRHFLQTGFADLELQHLWKHLKDEGLWDDSLIVVAADHGVAFPHARERRRLSRENARRRSRRCRSSSRRPTRRTGKTDDAWVETIDILPTIFDILNLDPRVKMDGRSAFSDEVQNRDELRILIRNSFEVLRIPADTFTRERRAIIDRNQRLFGSGADGPERLYEIGPNPELIGQPASAAGEELDVDLSYQRDYGNVGADPLYVPVHVVGRVNGPDRHPRDIAVAVNGTIHAVGNTFKLAVGDDGELVSVIVPESAFQKGRNRVQVFAAP